MALARVRSRILCNMLQFLSIWREIIKGRKVGNWCTNTVFYYLVDNFKTGLVKWLPKCPPVQISLLTRMWGLETGGFCLYEMPAGSDHPMIARCEYAAALSTIVLTDQWAICQSSLGGCTTAFTQTFWACLLSPTVPWHCCMVWFFSLKSYVNLSRMSSEIN